MDREKIKSRMKNGMKFMTDIAEQVMSGDQKGEEPVPLPTRPQNRQAPQNQSQGVKPKGHPPKGAYPPPRKAPTNSQNPPIARKPEPKMRPTMPMGEKKSRPIDDKPMTKAEIVSSGWLIAVFLCTTLSVFAFFFASCSNGSGEEVTPTAQPTLAPTQVLPSIAPVLAPPADAENTLQGTGDN